MRTKKRQNKTPRFFQSNTFIITLIIIVALLLIYLIAHNVTGYQIYDPYGYGGAGYPVYGPSAGPQYGGGSFGAGAGFGFGGWFNLVDLYFAYASWFDFFIFLVIFLGLGEMAFKKRFEEHGGKAMYIGIGIFLALSLLIFEETSGFKLIDLFSSWAFFIFILIITILIYSWISNVAGTRARKVAVGLSYFFFYIFGANFLGCGGFGFGYYIPLMDTLYQILPALCLILFLLLIGAGLLVVLGLWELASGRGREEG